MHSFARNIVVLILLFAAPGAPARAQDGAVPVTISGSGFTVGDLKSGATAFQNRKYVWQSVPPAMEGWKFTEVSGGVAATMTARAGRDGVLYVAALTPPPPPTGSSANPWARVEGLSLTYSDSKHTTLPVFRLTCTARATVEISQVGWAGTIVLAPAIDGAADVGVPAAASTVDRPPGVVLDYLPASSKAFVGSPSIAILPDGAYVAAHDIFGGGAPRGDETRLFRSADRGATWQPLARLKGSTWSGLFVHQGALYLLGPNTGFGQIVIRRSDDGGRTWTIPTGPNSGLLVAERGMHTAPTPVVSWRGRLWRALEYNPPASRRRNFQAFLLSAPENADLLKASSWTRTSTLGYEMRITGGNWLEGNAVVGPDDGLYDMLRISKDGLEKAALLRLAANGRSLGWDPVVDRIDMPGGGVKFTIHFDPVSHRYWTVANKQREPNALRNVLVLESSPDLRHWTVEATLLSHPDTAKYAFQYIDWLIDGDDIVAVSRTSWNGDTYHNANYLTFHRITNFRTPQRAIGP